MRRFPALEPSAGWQPADVDDLVQEFLEEKFVDVTTMLLTTARNDESMGRLLRRTIRHWLIDRARTTGTGRIRRRLEKVLGDSPEFERVPSARAGAGQWRITETSSEPWAGDPQELIQAASRVQVVRIGQWSSTSRRAPLATRESLIAVARAVLSAAGGSVEIAQLTHVFVTRFPAALDWAVVPLESGADGLHAAGSTPEEEVVERNDEVDASVGAAEIVGMLTSRERALVSCLGDVVAAQTLLGCRRSSAYQQMSRLREKLVQFAGASDDGLALIREVIHLCTPASE